ncbi:MAG: galactose oxidase [Myxococcales bacterium]|nr:galactose oxidase [Myxococcales bacterium]
MVATGDAIWVLGGFDGQARIVNDVRIFEPSIGAWRAGPPLPVRLHHANAAVVDGRLYVLGYLVQGFAAEGRAFRLDPAVGTWEERAPLPPARTRGASGVAVIDGLIYLAGGLGGGRAVALVDRYDPAADTWEALPDLPTPRDHMAAGAVDGRLVIAGGRSADIESHVDRVDVFDPARGTWASGAPMPTSRGGTAAAVLDGWLYVIGGEGNRGAASGVFDAVEAWHGATDRWVRLPAMPHPRHGMAAATLDGRIYVPGGASRQAFGAVDTLEVLAP